MRFVLEVVHESQRDEFFEGWLELSTFLREVSFFEVSDAGDTGGFFDDDEKLIDVGDSDIGRLDGFWERLFPEFDDIFGGHFADRVQAEVAIDLDFAASNRFTDLAPAPIGEPFFQGSFQDRSIVGGVQVEPLKGIGFLRVHRSGFPWGYLPVRYGPVAVGVVAGLPPPVGHRLQYKRIAPFCQWSDPRGRSETQGLLRPFSA